MHSSINRWLKASAVSMSVLTIAILSTSCQSTPPSPHETAAMTQEPYKVTLYSADPSSDWQNMKDETGQQITAKTGIVLDATFAESDGIQQLTFMATSGEYPDLIMPKGSANILVDAGGLLDLTELIDTYAPNIKRVYGKYYQRLHWSVEDPSIYILPTLNAVGQENYDASGTFHLQHEVVKELGYPLIRTTQDYEKAILTYKEKHPTIHGEPTIGLSLIADEWHYKISITNPAFYATGASDDGEYYIDPQTYQAKLHYRRPEEKEYFRWLNHMNAIGLLDPESFVQQYDQYLDKVASGRVLGLIDQRWSFSGAESQLVSKGMDERAYGQYPVTVTADYKDASFQDTGYMAGWGIGISKSCKDPVRVIKFLDWLASDEGQVLINWGVEHKHYQVIDGKRVIPNEIQEKKTKQAAEFSKTTGIGLYNMLSAHYGDGVKDSTGNYYTTNFPEQIIRSYSPVAQEVLQKYHARTWKDLFPQKELFSVKPWGAAWNIAFPANSEMNYITQRVDEVIQQWMPKIILATPAQFDALWQQFMVELDRIGAAKLEEAFTQLVKQRVELWKS